LELKEFISSGIIESYVLGIATVEEIRLVSEMEKLHPEVRTEIEEIEASLMRYAEMEAEEPSENLKKRIEDKLFEKKNMQGNKGRVVNISSLSGPSRWMKYAVAASVGLLIGVSAVTYSIYNKLKEARVIVAVTNSENEMLASEISKQQDEMSQIVTELTEKKIEIAMLMKPGSKLVALKGTDSVPEASARLLWNTKDNEVYITAAHLPMPPEGKQYQLWAMVNGKPVDAGVFTMTNGVFVMQKMKDIPNAQAFAVTLENMGGSASPTMEAMYVMGSV
jgi:anti-sigma-K factor RskA